jgi:hypothetical protein
MRPRARGTTTVAVGALLAIPFALLLAAAVGMSVLVGFDVGEQQTAACGLQPAGNSTLVAPMVPGSFRLTSDFGERRNPVTGAPDGHRGQDFGAPADAPIYAAASGTVVRAGPAGGFGQWIVIDHQVGGQLVSTVYGHMWPDGVGVAEGEQVVTGQPIGRVGSNGQSTGPHLHFEVWEGGRFAGGRAVDPMPLLSEPAAEPPPPVAAQLASYGPAPTTTHLMPRPPQGAQRETPLSAEQLRNAETIVGVGKGMGLPPRSWVIAIATAMQESTLLNLDYGDRDSVGLFQQRASQGWGSPAQIMDPTYSAEKFYEAFTEQVVATTPDWQSRPLTTLAQQVQRSGFPQAYAKWETEASNAVLAVHGAAPINGGPTMAC